MLLKTCALIVVCLVIALATTLVQLKSLDTDREAFLNSIVMADRAVSYLEQQGTLFIHPEKALFFLIRPCIHP